MLSNLFELIIFDLDDTLIRSSIDYSKIRLKLIKLFPEEAKPSSIHTFPILKLLKKLKAINDELHKEGRIIVETNERAAVKGAVVMKGAENLPELLHKFNLTGVIYTNNSRDTVNLYQAKSEFTFLNKFNIITRNDVNNPKPDPEGLLKIIDDFKLSNSNTIYIGDSYIDSEAASKANIEFILFNSRKLDLNSLNAVPLFVLDSWSDFEPLLEKLSNGVET